MGALVLLSIFDSSLFIPGFKGLKIKETWLTWSDTFFYGLPSGYSVQT